jgi:hypothetical protein
VQRIATLCGVPAPELVVVAESERWMPLAASDALRRRIAVMADRALAMLEQADGEALLEKSRLDLLSAMMKAIDRLSEQIERSDERRDTAAEEAVVTGTFEAIDRRIEELAHAYAERLVETESVGIPAAGGGSGVVPAGQG